MIKVEGKTLREISEDSGQPLKVIRDRYRRRTKPTVQDLITDQRVTWELLGLDCHQWLTFLSARGRNVPPNRFRQRVRYLRRCKGLEDKQVVRALLQEYRVDLKASDGMHS